MDGAGNLLIADSTGERISAVAARTGTFYGQAMTAGDIYTVAGNGKVGNDGDGLPATHARLDHPHDVAVDSAGNLLIDDYLNARIRLVAAHSGRSYGQAMKAGHIYSIAGSGVYPPPSSATAARPPTPCSPVPPGWPATPLATSSSPTWRTTGSGWWRPPRARSTGRL